MLYLVLEMWRSPTDEGGESSSKGVVGRGVLGVRLFKPSAFSLALLTVLLYSRSICRGSIGLGCT